MPEQTPLRGGTTSTRLSPPASGPAQPPPDAAPVHRRMRTSIGSARTALIGGVLVMRHDRRRRRPRAGDAPA